jgi:hypothetical protein
MIDDNISMNIPHEIFLEILLYIWEETDILRISLINKEIYSKISDNKFWILFDDDYKYANFNVYEQVRNLHNISYRINKFFDEDNKSTILFTGETLNVRYFCETGHDHLIINKYYDIYEQKVYSNDYCIYFEGCCADKSCGEDVVFIYKKFLNDGDKNKVSEITCSSCGCFGKTYDRSAKIYGNYVWCVTEHLVVDEKELDIKVFAYNILTNTQHIAYEGKAIPHENWYKLTSVYETGVYRLHKINDSLIISKYIVEHLVDKSPQRRSCKHDEQNIIIPVKIEPKKYIIHNPPPIIPNASKKNEKKSYLNVLINK